MTYYYAQLIKKFSYRRRTTGKYVFQGILARGAASWKQFTILQNG
jgi:hypothetical protein